MAATVTDAAARLAWIGGGVASSASILDRLPLLPDLMGAAARAWTATFASFATAPAEMEFVGLGLSRVDALPARRGGQGIFAILAAPGWSVDAAVHFDRTLVTAVVDAMFGGDGDGDDDKGNDSPDDKLSSVELRIADVAMRHMGDALAAAVALRMGIPFALDRILAKPDLGVLGRPSAPVIVASFAVKTVGRAAGLDVIFPQAGLEAHEGRLAAEPVALTATDDPRWSRRLEAEVGLALTNLRAAIDGPVLTLGDLTRLRPGQVLPLPVAAESRVRLTCADDELFRCDLGQSGGFYTVRIGEAATMAGHPGFMSAGMAEP